MSADNQNKEDMTAAQADTAVTAPIAVEKPTTNLDVFTYEEREQIVDQAMRDVDAELQAEDDRNTQMNEAQKAQQKRFEDKYVLNEKAKLNLEKAIRKGLIDEEAMGKIDAIQDEDLRRKLVEQRLKTAVTDEAQKLKLLKNSDRRTTLIDNRIARLAAELSNRKIKEKGKEVENPFAGGGDDDIDAALDGGFLTDGEMKST